MSQRTFIERTAMRPLILAITVSQNEEIVSRLLDSGEDGEEETDNFADFYGFLAKKAVELAKAYQPKLRDGIKVVVEMVNSVAKDEQDGDVDMKVEIAPNATTELKPIPYNNNEPINLPVDKGDLIKAKYDKGKFLADVLETNDSTQSEVHEYRYQKLTNSTETNSYDKFLKKWTEGDIEKVNNERLHLINNRPSYKVGLVDKVWNNAKNSKGRVLDPNLRPRKELFWDKSKGRFDQWHMGHRKGKKYSDLVDDYINGKISYDGFLTEYNDEKNYYPEDPSSNMGHKFE